MSGQVHEIYQRAGFSGSFQLGDRPAFVIVDLSRGFTDPECPLGSNIDDTVRLTRTVLDESRPRGLLNVFTSIGYDPSLLDGGAWLRKVPSLGELVIGSEWVEIDPRLGRGEGEPVIVKRGASAFFGTNLCSILTAALIDTVFVLGATTSGCVRATVVDSVQYGFNTFVVVDCVADRAEEPHRANLFDMTAKYADPITAEEVIDYVRKLSPLERDETR